MPGGNGARGRGGRGGGGAAAGGANGDNLQAARQFFMSLFGGGGQANGRTGPGGGGGGSGARRTGGGLRVHEGEWACVCGYPNRAFRRQCNACGCPRPGGDAQPAHGTKGGGAKSGMQQGGTYFGTSGKGKPRGGTEDRRWGGDGPVGADGARPMLGRYGGGSNTLPSSSLGPSGKAGQRKGAPAVGTDSGGGKGPGHRAAGDGGARRAPADGGGKPAPSDARDLAGGNLGSWAKPPRVVDEEGYTLVQPRRAWQASGKGDEQGAATERAGDPARAAVVRSRWGDEDSDDDMHVADDNEAEDQADEDGCGDGDPDPRHLRTKFEALARATRDLERRAQGGAEDPAVRALRTARDEAEREWRQAKSPAPLPTRMGRAQSKLDKAGAALTRARRAVDDFDQWADDRRATLVHRMQEADSWYRWRQQQLDALHEEAGERASGRTGGVSATADCSTVISERIADEWLPQLQSLLEHLQGNPEVEERLASMAASMQCAGQELSAARSEAAQAFDIGDDDEWDQGWGDHVGRTRDADKGDTNAQGGKPNGGTSCWRPEGPGRWARASNAQGKGPATATGPQGAHSTEDASGSGNMAAAAAEGSAGAAPGTPGTGNKRGAEGSTDDKCVMRQRTDGESREETDRKRAAELLQRQQEAIAAQQASHEAGEGGFGSATAQALAAQQFVADACKAVGQARKLGIEPRSNGKELVELTPMDLRQWMADNLGDEADWA